MRDSESFPALLQREGINVTMFTDWFELNKRDPAARTLTYVEIPKYYVCPLKLWEETWQILSEDILHKKRKRFNYHELQLTDVQIRNYCVLVIQDLLHRYDRSLEDFKDLPWHDPSLLTNMDNRLIKEALDFDIKKQVKIRTYDCARGCLFRNCFLAPPDRQILPVIPKAKTPEIVQACINRSELLTYCKVFTFTRNMRVNEYSANGALDTSKQEFDRWVLGVGDGNLAAKIKEGDDERTWIKIPKRLLIKEWDTSIEQIMAETYPNFTSRQTDEEYLKERAILTLRNVDADAVNEFMFKKLSGEVVTKNNADEICQASTDNIDQHQLYPVEFLNSLNFPGMPPHELCLKKNYQSCSYGMSTQATDSAMKLD
nr:hypothetical protein [Tanacetum cinerariifolium]